MKGCQGMLEWNQVDDADVEEDKMLQKVSILLHARSEQLFPMGVQQTERKEIGKEGV